MRQKHYKTAKSNAQCTSYTVDTENSPVSLFQEWKIPARRCLMPLPGRQGWRQRTAASSSELLVLCGKNFCPVWVQSNQDPSVYSSIISPTILAVAWFSFPFFPVLESNEEHTVGSAHRACWELGEDHLLCHHLFQELSLSFILSAGTLIVNGLPSCNFYFYFFWNQILLCSSGWSGTSYVDQTGLELAEV